MGLFDNLLTQQKPMLEPTLFPDAAPAPTTGTVAQPATDPFMNLISRLLTPPTASPGTSPTTHPLAPLIAALRNDPVGDANRTSGLPSYAAGSTSPFNTGFFKTADQRRQVEQSRLGY
jgi:hypothetical protein